MKEESEISMEQVIRDDGRYPLEAYGFLHEALSKAAKEVHGDKAEEGQGRHVSGQQLCKSLRDLAIERWGMLARVVLHKWNIHATIDFGNMVYLLIRHGMMRKTDEDSVEDFRDVYDFESAFKHTPNFELKE